MSIYATLWSLQFPRYGDYYVGCEWIRVTAQGVPAHIGTPTRGFGYEEGDPYAKFLPPPMEVNADGDGEFMRAVVIVTEETQKGTARSPQEYVNPLLVVSGRDYASISFVELHQRICDALRGKGPQVVAQSFTPDGGAQLILSDGRQRFIPGVGSCNPTFHLASVSTCDSGVIKSICSTGQDRLNPPTQNPWRRLSRMQ